MQTHIVLINYLCLLCQIHKQNVFKGNFIINMEGLW